MGLFDSWVNTTLELPKRSNHQITEPRSVIITNQIRTLPLHLKLTLYACIRLLEKDKKDIKVTAGDVFNEYKRLTAEVNTYSLSIGNIINYIKELELLGFLKCTYICKVTGQIRFIHMSDTTQIPKYVSLLKKDLDRDKSAAIQYHL